jgi:hypothetical protein
MSEKRVGLCVFFSCEGSDRLAVGFDGEIESDRASVISSPSTAPSLAPADQL